SGKGEHEAANMRLLPNHMDVLQRHVAVVRPLVIAPADMQAHLVARHICDRLVDRLDNTLDKAEELAERAVLIGQMPSEREVGAVELQQKAAVDDRLVFDPQRLAERGEIRLLSVIELVL